MKDVKNRLNEMQHKTFYILHLQVEIDLLNSTFQQASDLREEDPEQRFVRMFSFLKVMKYKPKAEAL